MIKNSLFLYKTLNNQLLDKINIEIIDTTFSYEEKGENIKLTIDNNEFEKYYLGSVPEYWEPDEKELNIHRTFKLNNVETLFGDEGIAPHNSSIGLGVKIYSKSAQFSKNIDLGYELDNTMSELTFDFNYSFAPSTLRGSVFIEIFFFSKNNQTTNLGFANEQGINLGVINNFEIIVDGDGAAFPIVEVQRKGEPLWKLVMNWTDLNNENFDLENIRLEINVKHQMYDYIFKDAKPSRFLLFEIMTNVMAQIIYKAFNDNLYDPVSAEEESITRVVNYWIEAYSIDTNSLESINYSLQSNFEDEMVG